MQYDLNHPTLSTQPAQRPTPLPWTYLIGKTLIHIETANIGDGKPCGMPVCSMPKSKEADAFLICEAVNSHAAMERRNAELVKALAAAEKRAAVWMSLIQGLPHDVMEKYNAALKAFEQKQALAQPVTTQAHE